MSYPKNCKITPKEYQDEIIKISQNFKIYETSNALTTYALGLSEQNNVISKVLKNILEKMNYQTQKN